MTNRFLFLCGCPRSGTTALTHVFNWHPEVLLGIERYAALFRRSPQSMTRELFSAERFTNIRQGDCGYLRFDQFPAYSNTAGRRLDPGDVASASLVGDKITQLYKDLHVFEGDAWAGAEVFVVQIIRGVFDVARSYEARSRDPKDKWTDSYVEGIREWSEAIEYGVRASEAGGARTKFLVVNYEGLFEGGEDQFVSGCGKLIRAIGLDVSEQYEQGVLKVLRAGEHVVRRRLARGELVSNEEIASYIPPRSLENFRRLRERALV